jgi:DNA replication protein DnaC
MHPILAAHEARLLTIWDNWGAPKQYDPQKAQNCPVGYERLKGWVQGGCKGNIFLHGNSGSGKTFAARLLCERLHKRKHWPIGFLKCSQFQQLYFNNPAALKKYWYCRIIVLDDLPDLQVNRYNVIGFKDFMDDMTGCRLIITSNLPQAEIKKNLLAENAPIHTVEAILSRLGDAEAIKFEGCDLRA